VTLVREPFGSYWKAVDQLETLLDGSQTALDAPSVLGRTERWTTGREEERWIGCFHQELLATFNYERDII